MNKSISKDIENYLELRPTVSLGFEGFTFRDGMIYYGLCLIVRLLYMIYMEMNIDESL